MKKFLFAAISLTIILFLFDLFGYLLINSLNALVIVCLVILVINIIIIRYIKKTYDISNKLSKLSFIFSVFLIVILFSYLVTLSTFHFYNKQYRYNEEILDERSTTRDTEFFKCESFIYSYSQTLNCVNVYENTQFIKSFNLFFDQSAKNQAYLIDDIFYVNANFNEIYAFQNGNYYGKLVFGDDNHEGIDNVFVYNSKDICTLSYYDSEMKIRSIYHNYYGFTESTLYYDVYDAWNDHTINRCVVSDGHSKESDYNLIKKNDFSKFFDKIHIHDSNLEFRVKQKPLLLFFPIKLPELFGLVLVCLILIPLNIYGINKKNSYKK